MTATVLPMVIPMLAKPGQSLDLASCEGTHAFDTKLDGLRCLAMWDGENLRLLNRNGVDITAQFPEVVSQHPFASGCPMLLDGELVAVTGQFQDIARRGKQRKPLDIRLQAKSNPAVYVAFDLLYEPVFNDVRARPWTDRRGLLDHYLPDNTGSWITSVVSLQPEFYENVKALGGEGVIVKRLASPYRPGRHSDWTKHKVIFSVTCIATGYEKGTGARAEFGALHVSMLDAANVPVQVGRVGTGFTNAEIGHLKATLDSGTPLVVEVECQNVSRDGALRFPSYKGIRTDVSVLDAMLSQLDAIPRT